MAGSLDNAAHVIQLALTPVFLLTAVGSLLNVFSSRLARVVDRVHQMKRNAESADSAELARLRLRSQFLDAAVLAAAVAGALTCGAAATIFFGVLRDAATASVLFGLFGAALVAAIVALTCFAAEVLLSGRAVRAHIDDAQPTSECPTQHQETPRV
ncbi:DUF2721 domain-containing protein [Sphingomonas sp. MA1305]|uniref:DUF2721 domain-containing protein n=1 Tax=unclassified Sphingomonas TaxID=196159 RepID=UPI0018DFEB89|nr:DUF2721 domain-containing protein [Sphingomonas sp. MA1305]